MLVVVVQPKGGPTPAAARQAVAVTVDWGTPTMLMLLAMVTVQVTSRPAPAGAVVGKSGGLHWAATGAEGATAATSAGARKAATRLGIFAPAWVAAVTDAAGGGDTTWRVGAGTVGGVALGGVDRGGVVTVGEGVTVVDVVDPGGAGGAPWPMPEACPAGDAVVIAGVVLDPKAALGAIIIEHATKTTAVRTAALRSIDRGWTRLGRDR